MKSTHVGSVMLLGHSDLPVTYVSEAEAQQLVWQLEDKGYVVREGTLAQLEQLENEVDQKAQNDVEEGKELDCKKDESKHEAVTQIDGQSVEKPEDQANTEKELSTKEKIAKDKKCAPEKMPEEVVQQNTTEVDVEPLPEPEPVPPHEHYPEPEVHGSVGLQLNVSGGSGSGSNHDFAKVFFIFVGIAVVAAFVVYAGKYIADMARSKNKKLWRELIFNSTFLSTKSGRHGQFLGAKLVTGFVSSELIQLALVGEVGNTNLDLVLNENTDPTLLDFSATYWMLGASARMHLSDKLVNASYLYLDFMGGTTSRSVTDLIGAARFGASFGLNDYWRLGASVGAQYIGLDEDQGFSNDGDNYWTTYGVEVGARF